MRSSSVLALAPELPAQATDAPRVVGPFTLGVGALALTSAAIGIQWDISWHVSIGRDAFWSPPHVAIYLGGVLAGLISARCVAAATFGSAAARAASVQVLGLRGPLGAFVAGWGGLAMLVSAPFDDWWHSAYGLDVEVLSLPHSLLFLGMFAIHLGVVLLVAGERNRTDGLARAQLTALLLYLVGLVLSEALTGAVEHTSRTIMHSGTFYRTVALVAPFLLTAGAGVSGHRWGCTAVAATYTGLMLALLWILPLFPAQPRLGPVYVPVTHFVPPEFPLLLLVPAVAMDVLRRRQGEGAVLRAVVLGTVFWGVFLAVQWPFADFLMSEGARNAVFGSHYFGFDEPPHSALFQHRFLEVEKTPLRLALNLGLALALSIALAGAGERAGRWASRLVR